MSTTDEIMGLVDRWADMCAAKTLSDGTTRHEYAAIEARVAALVAERDDLAGKLAYARETIDSLTKTNAAATERIAALEAENRALREAGKVLLQGSPFVPCFQDAMDIFTGQPGALESWLGKEKG